MRLPLVVVLVVSLAGAASVLAQPAGDEVSVPFTAPDRAGVTTDRLAATYYRPAGDGPFPAIVLSHGSTSDSRERRAYAASFAVATEVFVRWGFAVLVPVRRGYGRTGGAFAEDYGPCSAPHYLEAGIETARDLPVRAVVNFAGGRGGKQHGVPHRTCSPERLVEAAGALGRGAAVPSLWLYTENDQYFSPGLSRRMHEAYVAGGARATFHLLPAIGHDGHRLIGLPDGVPLWRDTVEAFLRETGLRP